MLGLPPARLPNRLAPVLETLPAVEPEVEGRGAKSAEASALGAGGPGAVELVCGEDEDEDGDSEVGPGVSGRRA